jgi:hypothetical protein
MSVSAADVSAPDGLHVASTEAAAPAHSVTSRFLVGAILATELAWLAFLAYVVLELIGPSF